MIKLERTPKPQILIDNETIWTTNLLDAISAYGSYSKIPKEQKEKLLAHYRHESIKNSLFNSSLHKCAFCETKPSESGNIEVEHFLPKSSHPNLAFKWENFLPACRKCNGSKSDHDSLNEPIINPYDTDPDDVFSYKDIRISANSNEHQSLGEMTIKVCSLNSVRLMKPRAEILVSLHSFSIAIEEATQDYFDADTDQKRRNRKRKLREALETIESLTTPSEKFSGFCKSYLSECEPYNLAKKIINDQCD
ncbi:HNH endonuclease [Photobacterium leiognathi]|uniref:HNH endonuclease n=1 Tax=Photobacterium leiognathi TaxID=553611 RepID=UPI001EDCCE50|nr:HNH endonuclease [Photobacterium leiognathi]MCG3885825.1 HNH endonuclease [Photobacterium leiognathi]